MSSDDLTAQVRTIVHAHPAADRTAEKQMFGSDAFLVSGNLACGASRKGLLVRVDRDEAEVLLEQPEAEPMEMRGRGMPGWLRVDPTGLDEASLAAWVRRGLDFAASLPPK
jgi:TfoX/Sxy family transcriptional regulator of competence genes